MNETSMNWLCSTLLEGEHTAWQAIAGVLPPGVELPAELIALAKAEDPVGQAQLALWSNQLRRLCAQTPTASASVVLAAAAVLRLSALGHEDQGWSSLLPRWLVPSLSAEQRSLGLLALALNSREQLAADDYADLMDQAVHLLPPACRLRSAHLYQYALYLGLRGMLRRLSNIIDLPRPGDQEPEVDPSILAECFYDAICCGRAEQAAFLESRLQATPESAWQLGLFHMHRVFIPVFQAISRHAQLPDLSEVPSLDLLRALVERDFDVLESFDPDIHRGDITPLLSFDSLRVTLACRKQDQARALLDARLNSVERHWLDDFFLARLLLQENNPLEAGAAFERVEAAALRYGAMERLELELRLSCELNFHDCCRLGMLGAMASRRTPPVAPGPALAKATPPHLHHGAAFIAGNSALVSALRQSLDTLTGEKPQRMLLLGPDDGSRYTIAALLHERFSTPGPLRYFNALACRDPSWLVGFRKASEESGSVILDDFDRLDPGAQVQVLPVLQGSGPARIICAASSTLTTALHQGTLRPELYWSIAEWRVQISALQLRSADLADILLALLGEQDSHLRWEAPARQAMSKVQLPGGWAQLQVLARILGRTCTEGTIDIGSLDMALGGIGDPIPAAPR